MTDADEVESGAGVADTANNEATATIGGGGAIGSYGTTGFSLAFTQVPCA